MEERLKVMKWGHTPFHNKVQMQEFRYAWAGFGVVRELVNL
jgi:hypothetical protein